MPAWQQGLPMLPICFHTHQALPCTAACIVLGTKNQTHVAYEHTHGYIDVLLRSLLLSRTSTACY